MCTNVSGGRERRAARQHICFHGRERERRVSDTGVSLSWYLGGVLRLFIEQTMA